MKLRAIGFFYLAGAVAWSAMAHREVAQDTALLDVTLAGVFYYFAFLKFTGRDTKW